MFLFSEDSGRVKIHSYHRRLKFEVAIDYYRRNEDLIY